MAAAAILKNRKLTCFLRGLSDFDKIWHSDVLLDCSIVKNKISKNPILWLKSRYRDNSLTNRHEIWHGDAVWHL